MIKTALLCALGLAQVAHAQVYECEELLFPRQAGNRLYGYINLLGEWRVDPVFVKAGAFQGRYAVVMQGKRYGVLNCDGILVVPADFDEILNFSEGAGWVRRDKLWGLVDDRGRMLVPLAFSEVKPVAPLHPLHWVKRDDKWGLFDKVQRKFIVQPKYAAVQVLSDESSLVRLENDFGLLHHNGSFILPFGIREVSRIEQNVFSFREGDHYGAFDVLGNVILLPDYDTIAMRDVNILFKQKGLYGMTTYRGQKIVPAEYQAIGDYHNGLAPVQKGGKWGYLTTAGKLVVPLQYEAVQPFWNGNMVVKEKGKWGILRPNGKWQVEPVYDTIARNYPQHNFYAARRSGTWQLLDLQGRLLSDEKFVAIELSDPANFLRVRQGQQWAFFNKETHRYIGSERYEQVRALQHGAAFARQRGKWGAVDTLGRWAVPPQYDSLRYVVFPARTLFQVQKGKEWGVVEAGGNAVVPVAYERIVPVEEDLLLKVKQAGAWGVLRAHGEPVLPPAYAFMSNGEDQPTWPAWPAVVARKEKWGLLSEQGTEVVKPKYGPIQALGEGWYAWEEKGKLGLLSAKGEEALPPTYLEIRHFEHNWAAAKRPEGWGFINQRGNPATEFVYEEVTDFNGTSAYVKRNGKWGAINRQGKYLLPLEYSGYHILPDGTRRLYK
ncbi:WG containing repeat-containing protein [Catalinimonas alkaloidigena]|uniref:WG containing repeat-containing protein n=1 Tax=Catalinimonas alkaloidigena TaxID=1075417 RepID=A0A1G8X8T8_9BACT|nr:WG repeat-containing protein [Catalinimonas alkaloidigena]SDJ87078.1 WG containing repeat-containing protein [Catalinimonas alkaloidigena]